MSRGIGQPSAAGQCRRQWRGDRGTHGKGASGARDACALQAEGCCEHDVLFWQRVDDGEVAIAGDLMAVVRICWRHGIPLDGVGQGERLTAARGLFCECYPNFSRGSGAAGPGVY